MLELWPRADSMPVALPTQTAAKQAHRRIDPIVIAFIALPFALMVTVRLSLSDGWAGSRP
jgi:hypothetical protein